MFENGKEDLMEYCFRFMISKDNLPIILNNLGIPALPESLSAVKVAQRLRNDKSFNISLSSLETEMRNIWKPTNKALHIENLKLGLLVGHDWHGAMPSIMHLNFQSKVRDVCSGKMKLQDFLSIGTDIAKQEYFIVATHDLLETTLIESFQNTTPSIANKGISDFIFGNFPYDLKAGGVPSDWTLDSIKKNPAKFAQAMYDGADSERLRKQAEKSINNWGLSRFYVIVADDTTWIKNPELVLDKFVAACTNLGQPISINSQGLEVLCQVVIVE